MYESYFGLSRKPFNATPDPRFLYTNRCYREAYAMLLYGVQERKGFIALTGEVGTGKTTLLRRLMESMNAAIKVVFVYNTALSFDELVEFICTELGIEVAGLARLERLKALNQFLIAEARRGGTVVLLLDEAQNLSAEALENLRLISNLETATDKLLQIVLAGQPELEAKLSDPALRQVTQRIALRFRLEPLDDSEVEPYIDCRLRVVGRSRKDLFTNGAIRKLVPYVNGIPRLINIVCDNALLLAYAMDRKQVTDLMIDSVIADLRLRSSRGPARLAHRAAELTWSRADARAGGTRWGWLRFAVAGVVAVGVVGVALALLGAALGRPSGSPNVAGPLSSLGALTDRILGRGRQPAGTSGATPEQGPERAAPAAEPRGQTASKPPSSAAQSEGGAAASPDVGRPAPEPSEAESQAPEPAAGSATEPSPQVPTDESRPRGPARIAGRTLTIPNGGTISGIVFDHYGRYSSLALDLIQELNPDITDVDVVAAGQRLWLPPLDLNALLRRQANGSYRLIVSSQPSLLAARKVAQTVRAHGYAVAVTTREVAPNHVLYRVEINALKTRAAATRAWETAKRLDWFEPRPDGTDGPSRRSRVGLSLSQ